MKAGRHEEVEAPEEQSAFAPKRAESGATWEGICRKMGISQAMLYMWRKNFGGLGVIEPRRLQIDVDVEPRETKKHSRRE